MRPSRSGAKAIARRGANVACARDIVAVKTDAIFQRESLVDRPLVLEELRVDIEPLEQ